MKEKALLLVFGEGGHNAEMQKLLDHLKIDFKDVRLIALVDSERCCLQGLSEKHVVTALRSKHHSLSVINVVKALFISTKSVLSVMRKYKCAAMVSTGPGINVIPALFMTLLSRPVIHVETACRFNTASMNGRVMYKLSSHFYVQNKEQLVLYPSAKWSGRL